MLDKSAIPVLKNPPTTECLDFAAFQFSDSDFLILRRYAMIFVRAEIKRSQECRVMIPDQNRFHTRRFLTEYDAVSIGSADAADWSDFLRGLFSFVLAVL